MDERRRCVCVCVWGGGGGDGENGINILFYMVRVEWVGIKEGIIICRVGHVHQVGGRTCAVLF